MSPVYLVIVLLLSSWMEVQSAPTPPKPRPQKEVLRPELPDNVDFSKLPLTELVKYRPRISKYGDGKRYRTMFSEHPDIQRINLHDPKRDDTVNALLALNVKGTPGLKARMTASIRNHIKDAHFDDEAHKTALLKHLDGTRRKEGGRARRLRFKAKVGQKGLNASRFDYEKKHKAKTGIGYQVARKRAKKENPLLNKPLSFHFDAAGLDKDSLTALQAEEEARQVQNFYPTKGRLTVELDKYLQEKRFPPDQYNAALAARAQHLYENSKKRKRKSDTTTHADVQATTPAGSAVEHSHHEAQLEHHDVAHPQQQSLTHSTGFPDWDWLEPFEQL